MTTQTALIAILGSSALLLVSIYFVYFWTGRRQHELSARQFDGWCRKAYFGMTHVADVSELAAQEKEKTGSGRRRERSKATAR